MDIGPGDYVECIDASPCFVTGRCLVEKAVYVVSEARDGRHRGDIVPGVWLVGDAPRFNKSGDVMGWRADRFRPIYRPKADAFTHILTDITSDLEAV